MYVLSDKLALTKYSFLVPISAPYIYFSESDATQPPITKWCKANNALMILHKCTAGARQKIAGNDHTHMCL